MYAFPLLSAVFSRCIFWKSIETVDSDCLKDIGHTPSDKSLWLDHFSFNESRYLEEIEELIADALMARQEEEE